MELSFDAITLELRSSQVTPFENMCELAALVFFWLFKLIPVGLCR